MAKKTRNPVKKKQETSKKRCGGFASMSSERLREVAAKGGKAVKPQNRSFSKDRQLAVRAGRVGGANVANESRSFSRDRTLAAEAGRKGGTNKGAS